MADRLPNWSNSILGSKRPALNCAKCHLRDSPRVSTWPDVVRLVHQWPTKCCYLWLCPYVRRWHLIVYCIGDTVDNTVTYLDKALSELNSWCLQNSLTPHSAKCEAMLLMRKPHIAPRNSVTIGEDRIGSSGWNTLVFWVLLSMKGFPGHHLTDVKKNFVNKLDLEQKRPFGLVLQDNITISSIWTSHFGRMP